MNRDVEAASSNRFGLSDPSIASRVAHGIYGTPIEGISCRRPLDSSSLGEKSWVAKGLADVFAPAGANEL